MIAEQNEEFIKSFERIKEKAELRALSNLSLEKPLIDKQHKRIMELKKVALE